MNELDDMRLFVRAVATGSLSAAGRELGFSPPSAASGWRGWRRGSACGCCSAARGAWR
ncbi:helix-turn-helix domain-containing protein [Roseateles chitinivorans]|uniref:helix-turn-helix domain-containing protein n=1 Tax=Roseateles chitinivorans TaxID=2917965 RepID=UPI003D67C191